MGTLKKIRILGNVNHNNVELKKYHVYEMDETQAEPLVKAKVAEYEQDAETPVDPIKSKKRGKNPGELVDADPKKAAEPKKDNSAKKAVEPVFNTVKGGEKNEEDNSSDQFKPSGTTTPSVKE